MYDNSIDKVDLNHIDKYPNVNSTFELRYLDHVLYVINNLKDEYESLKYKVVESYDDSEFIATIHEKIESSTNGTYYNANTFRELNGISLSSKELAVALVALSRINDGSEFKFHVKFDVESNTAMYAFFGDREDLLSKYTINI